jgi:hypothetical protein
MVAQADREVRAMPVPREQLLEELRKVEQARDLLSELERELKGENHPERGRYRRLGRYLTQLEQLAQSLPEGHSVRQVIESALEAASVDSVSRARSALEGEISALRGAIEGVEDRADT